MIINILICIKFNSEVIKIINNARTGCVDLRHHHMDALVVS